MKYSIILLVSIACFSCKKENKKDIPIKLIKNKQVVEKGTFVYNDIFITDGFDFPVGKPDAKKYYNAQKFQENLHLGDDWNGIGGGNTDKGDSIFSTANGYVTYAEDFEGGWGNVIKIKHKLPSGKFVESLYAHCDTIIIRKNQYVKRGQQIATIGTANGIYLAHLHLEMRDSIGMEIGDGYSSNIDGYLDPTVFIKANRP